MTPDRPAVLQVCAVDFTARRFLLPLMRSMRAEGFDVHLACRPGNESPIVEREGFPVHPIDFDRSYNVIAHARAWRQLRALLRRQTFQVVHTHTPIASLIARPVARGAGVPVVIYTAHGFYFHEGMRPLVRRVHVGLERWAQRRADYLFSQSAEDLQSAIDLGIAPREAALAIGNGVDTTRFDPDSQDPAELKQLRAELGIPPDAGPVVVIIGRLVREKGYFEFLDAFARLLDAFPTARALIIGDALPSDHDDSAAAIRGRAAELGLGDSAIFAGLRDDVPRLLALGDIFCLPSWREGMPRVVIEAMAASLPVVATDIRGCREEVVPGESGLLVPARDAPALADALITLARDPDRRRAMGRAGRHRATTEFEEQIVIERQMKVLSTLLDRKNVPWPAPLDPSTAP